MIISTGDIYPLAGAATFSVSSVIIRKLELYGTPIQLNFIRTSIGAIIFLIHLIVIGQLSSLFHLSFLVIFYLILSVLFNVVIGDSSYFASQNRLGVKIATPIANTYPFFTIILAVLWLEEIIRSTLIIGGSLLILGIIFLSIDRTPQEDEIDNSFHNWVIGLILVFLAVLSYSLGIIYTTIATEGLSVIVANSIRLPSGALLLSGMMVGQHFRMESKINNTNNMKLFFSKNKQSSLYVKGLLLIAGVFGTYLSSIFLVLSVQTVGASRSAILFATGPFFALPLAVFWIKEKVGWKTLIGTFLTVVGLWIVLF